MDNLGVLVMILVVLAIPLVAVVSHGIQKVWRLRLEEARTRAGGLDAPAANELSALRADVAQMREELDELQERMDFTERALAQSRERMRLPSADES